MKKVKKFPIWMRVALLLLLGLVGLVVGKGIGVLIPPILQMDQPVNVLQEDGLHRHTLHNVLYGGVCLIFGLVGVVSTYFSNAFTFSFKKPYWKTAKKTVWFAQFICIPVFLVGIALFMLIVAIPLFATTGVNLQVVYNVGIFGTLIIGMIFLSYYSIWDSMFMRMVYRRLQAKGVSEEDIMKGQVIGISNPERSSGTKLVVEDDIGLLLIRDERIEYHGDAEDIVIDSGKLVEVIRKTDRLSLDAVGGVVHLILRFKDSSDKERKIRIHAQDWSMGLKKKGMEKLHWQFSKWYDAQPVQN
ncbi:MAG: hypothetical protein GY847_16440 [Proteobacteria bacterium]|nr:hypothetical protein [Pseudomonadota bacterium]